MALKDFDAKDVNNHRFELVIHLLQYQESEHANVLVELSRLQLF